MVRNKKTFIPVKEILGTINSCESIQQLNSCRNLISNYVRLMAKRGLVNPEDLENRLIKELKQKHFQITMIKSFMQRQTQEHSEKKLVSA